MQVPMTVEDAALTFVRGLGARGTVRLMEVFGSARAVYEAGADRLVAEAELNAGIARRISSREGFAEAERELRRCEREGIRVVASTDSDYPQTMLRGTSDYPHVLYVMGDVSVLNSAHMLSIVGTRRCSVRSEAVCMKIVGELAERVEGLCIVSGLAFGVDSHAHRAALAAGVPTVAFVPSVLPGVVPLQHTRLAGDILSRGGAIVSELNSSARQNGSFYIARNRLIASAGEGTLVVESHLKGGSLRTAEMADSYYRTVMAVPGRPGDRESAGTNALISRNAARLVCTAADVADSLDWSLGPGREAVSEPSAEYSAEERAVLGCFAAGETLDPDTIAARCGADIGSVMSALMMLELAGAVRTLPGGACEKIVP